MIGCLTEAIKEDPTILRSKDLINQLGGIERGRGGNISSESFCDLFMAASFCAYVRKMKAVEILPLINLGVEVVQTATFETFKSFIGNPSIDTANELSQRANIFNENEIDQLMILDSKKYIESQSDNIDGFFSPFF